MRFLEFFEEGESGKLSHLRLAFFLFTLTLIGMLVFERPVPWEFYTLYASVAGLKVWQRFAERLPAPPARTDGGAPAPPTPQADFSRIQ